MTIVGRRATAQQQPELTAMQQIADMVNQLAEPFGGNPLAVSIRTQNSQFQLIKTTTYEQSMFSKITLVNPVLVSANEGFAPYVFDVVVKPGIVSVTTP
jgi:hypothetical protein